MPKIPKNSIIVIALSIISLILGGTFFAISQNKSGQNLNLNSTSTSSSQMTTISQSSNFSTSSISSTNPSSTQVGLSQSSVGVSSLSRTANNSQSKILETAFLEKCGLEIRYNPDKYYLAKQFDLLNYKDEYFKTLEVREKNLATGNQTIIEYQCNLDNYNFYTVSTAQKLFPSSNYKIPLFSQPFWSKAVEAGRIEFPENVALRTKEEFPMDWFLVKDNPNFQAGIKTENGQNEIQKTIFHQVRISKDPSSFDGKDLQFGLIDSNSKATKNILSYQEFEKVQAEEFDKDAKRIKKFQNWEQIKFDGKINKVSDIPEDLIKKYGVPQFGFRFYKGVAFWSGYLKGGTENTEQNSKDGGLIAFDGQKVVEIKSENSQELKNYFGYEIGTYYLSSLIKDGVGYNFGSSCGGWGCFADFGFFIDFDKGQYWQSLEGIDKDNYNNPKVDQKLLEPYLTEDFPSWKGLGQPRIIGPTGYTIYKNGKIYGRFQKYTGKVKDGYPESAGFFVVESDGQNYKFLYETRVNCQNLVTFCGGEMVFNSRGNLVYFGGWTEEEDVDKKENNKIKISEQDFKTGKILQEETGQDTPKLREKYGVK
jgi:hypothetical protein